MLRHTNALHYLHGFWQRRFTARGRERERSWLAYRPDELPQRHPDDQNDKPENQDNENEECQVKRQNKIAQIYEHAETLGADRVSHRRADAKGREHHHIVGELEHDLRKTLHRANDWLSFLADC